MCKYPDELKPVSEAQFQFLIEQHKTCREEIVSRFQSIEQSIMFAVGATGVLWSWILTSDTRPALLHWIPFAVALLSWLRVEALISALMKVNEYLRKIEHGLGLKGWETFAVENKIGKQLDRWHRFALFVPLLLGNAALAIALTC